MTRTLASKFFCSQLLKILVQTENFTVFIPLLVRPVTRARMRTRCSMTKGPSKKIPVGKEKDKLLVSGNMDGDRQLHDGNRDRLVCGGGVKNELLSGWARKTCLSFSIIC